MICVCFFYLDEKEESFFVCFFFEDGVKRDVFFFFEGGEKQNICNYYFLGKGDDDLSYCCYEVESVERKEYCFCYCEDVVG